MINISTSDLAGYFDLQVTTIDPTSFLINISLTVLIAFILKILYVNYGNSASNRKTFANNFVMVAVTTMMIIMIVKSSLALSLGLVGALSIVRFRTAIKDPEELAYIFLTIAIGLGMGAEQTYITLLVFFVISIIIIVRGLFKQGIQTNSMYLSISSEKPSLSLDEIIGILKKHTSSVKIKRLDTESDLFEILADVDIKNANSIEKVKAELLSLDRHMKLSFLDYRGITN